MSRAWNGLRGDVLVEPASVGLFKSRVNTLLLTLPSHSSHGTLVFRPCLRSLLSHKKCQMRLYRNLDVLQSQN
nr:unnamed protein product [Callosobruchus chinensis]